MHPFPIYPNRTLKAEIIKRKAQLLGYVFKMTPSHFAEKIRQMDAQKLEELSYKSLSDIPLEEWLAACKEEGME